VRVLIVPDKFRGALDASQVADALAEGVRDARPEADVALCPLGDGGEGTGPVLAGVLGATAHAVIVRDPLGRMRSARWWMCSDGRTGIVEMAEASGLALLAAEERAALRTTTFGTGQLLQAPADAGCERVLLCVGGSATVDGGAGCLQALGWELIDQQGVVIAEPVAGGQVGAIAALRPPNTPPAVQIEILCDVDNPLLGPSGAAAVFGPQKGATPAEVKELEAGLSHWAEVLERDCGVGVRVLPGGGAAGGLPAGLSAALDARLAAGFDEVARRVDLAQRLAACDVCLTGEGCIDEQTSRGKVVVGVARLAGECGVPTVGFAGAVRSAAGETIEQTARDLGLERIVVITPPDTPISEALRLTGVNLRAAACRVLRDWR